MNLFYIRNLLIGSLNNSKYRPGDIIAECPSDDYPNVGYDYELELEQNGLYEIIAVGGGGGSGWHYLYNKDGIGYAWIHSGGSAASFYGKISLIKGNYTFRAGSIGASGVGTTTNVYVSGKSGKSGCLASDSQIIVEARGGNGGRGGNPYDVGSPGEGGSLFIYEQEIDTNGDNIPTDCQVINWKQKDGTGQGTTGGSTLYGVNVYGQIVLEQGDPTARESYYKNYGKGNNNRGHGTNGYFKLTYLGKA